MTNIYQQHDAAFAAVSAYVIAKDGAKIGSVSFKRGASRVTAFVHFLGSEMVRGHADGGGYDKNSAAAASAARKMRFTKSPAEAPINEQQSFEAFRSALERNGGYSWDRCLTDAGFTVWQAV